MRRSIASELLEKVRTSNYSTPEGVMSTAEINQIQRIIKRTMVSDLVELSLRRLIYGELLEL